MHIGPTHGARALTLTLVIHAPLLANVSVFRSCARFFRSARTLTLTLVTIRDLLANVMVTRSQTRLVRGARTLTLTLVPLLGLLTNGGAFAAETNDSQIKKTIITQSIAQYPGPCPCPYNTMRNGRSCGGNSAYSKPGGYDPICYEEDVTEGMIQQYRARMR